MIPFPVPLAVAFLTSHPDLAPLHGGRVSTVLRQPLPAVRVSLIGGAPATRWEWRPELQIEAWAEDEMTAGTLATSLREVWTTFRGPVDGGFVSGAWIVSEPRHVPDDQTDLARYLLVGAFAVHPPKEE